MLKKKRGLLIIIAGPSGVGKGTVREIVMKNKSLNLDFSVSLTTRKKRIGEVNGKDYYFVTTKEFKDAIKNNEFLEYAKFVNNYYGTSKKQIEDKRNKGKNVLLEIEIKGTKQVISQFSKNELITFFIVPPSIKELEKRIRGRKTESEEAIQGRLKKAKQELKMKKYFDHIIVNDDPKRAAKEIIKIIKDAKAYRR